MNKWDKMKQKKEKDRKSTLIGFVVAYEKGKLGKLNIYQSNLIC